MTLYMSRAEIDLNAFNRWAGSRKQFLRGGFDEGYALHGLLVESLGELAPKPFRLISPRNAPRAVLYGYGGATAETLRDQAQILADPLQIKALGANTLQTKPMPEIWTAGQKLGFDIRLRPVRRLRPSGDRLRSIEQDAFQWRAEQTAVDETPPSREQVYGDWLAERLERQGGAKLEPGSVRMASFRRTHVTRKTGNGDHKQSEGPDAVLHGHLTIADSEQFAALLAGGIGRHKAFGYGMLLLRPALA